MNVRVYPARMVVPALIMSTAILVPVNQASQAFSVRLTCQTALRAPVLMGEPALMGSMVSNAPAAQDSLEITASMKLTSVTLSHASMEEFVKMPWSHIAARVQKAILAHVASIQLIGADLLTHARTVVAADKKMPPSHVTVWVAGQVVIVISQECPVKSQPDREAARQMNFASTVDTVSTLATRTTANVRQTTQAVTASLSLTTVRKNLASMAPPAEATWEDLLVIVCLVMRGTTVRERSMSASLTHVRMEEPALT